MKYYQTLFALNTIHVGAIKVNFEPLFRKGSFIVGVYATDNAEIIKGLDTYVKGKIGTLSTLTEAEYNLLLKKKLYVKVGEPDKKQYLSRDNKRKSDSVADEKVETEVVEAPKVPEIKVKKLSK